MFKPEIAFYLGKQKSEGYSGIISQDNLFFCLEIHEGVNQEEGYKILDFIKENIKTFLGNRHTSLHDFDDFISSVITQKNFPAGFSLAAGYLKENILYLKTVGRGKVYIRRKGNLGLLIEGNNTASGPVENGDFFIFLTDNFFDLIGGASGLGKTFDHRKPAEIIDEITPILKAKNDLGAAALFVNLRQAVEDDSSLFMAPSSFSQKPSPTRLKQESDGLSIKSRITSIWQYLQSIGQQKTLTFITVLILFFVFFWSVILGFQRRMSASANEKIKLTRELITQKLSTAEEVAFLNMERAIVLISESKKEVEKLKKEVGDKKKEIEKLENQIFQTENKILKKEQRQYSEFFDLALDDKAALGSKIYLDGETAFTLDKKRGVIYQLSMEKKSLKKNQFSEIKSAELVAGFENKSFFYAKGSGVFQIDSDGKLKKVINADKNWGEIKDMYIYNGNIYLMDKGKDEIWKYLRIEDGYGGGNTYFERGQAIDLFSINSLAIDGSIYLAGDSTIVKYTSGLRDGFKIDLPENKINIVKVFTTKDLEKIYLWDKSKGAVYVIGKTGEYIEQVNSEILAKGEDVVVYKDKIYILKESKVYIVN